MTRLAYWITAAIFASCVIWITPTGYCNVCCENGVCTFTGHGCPKSGS